MSRLARTILVTSVVLATLGGHADGASAKDLKGRFGIGVEQALNGVTGLTARYWMLQELGLHVTVGARIIALSDNDALATTVQASVGLIYNVARSVHANLGIGARVGLGFRSKTAAQLVDSGARGDAYQVNIEVPALVLEFFLSDSFSISVATGIVVMIVPEHGATLGDGDETTVPNSVIIDLGAGSVTGTIGVVYYF